MTLFVPIGKISSAHGLKGEFKIFYYSNNADDFKKHAEYFTKDQEPLDLKIRATQKKHLIASISNTNSREGAEALIGTEIYIFLAQDDTDYYYAELINMTICDQNGKKLGKITEIANYGAGDIVEIQFSNGKSEMHIFNKENFPNIDRDQAIVTFIAPENI